MRNLVFITWVVIVLLLEQLEYATGYTEFIRENYSATVIGLSAIISLTAKVWIGYLVYEPRTTV